MAKACVVLLADTDTHEAMGRMANALTCAKDFVDAGDAAVLIFDGAGTKWVLELDAQAAGPHRRGLLLLSQGVRRQGEDRVKPGETAQRISRPSQAPRVRLRWLPGADVLMANTSGGVAQAAQVGSDAG